jgi:hypothetical protein
MPITYRQLLRFLMENYLNNENGVDCALKLRQQDENLNLKFSSTTQEFGEKARCPCCGLHRKATP